MILLKNYNCAKSLRISGAFPAWPVYQVVCYRSSDFTGSEFVIQLLLWAVLEDKEPIHSNQESWNLSSKSRIWLRFSSEKRTNVGRSSTWAVTNIFLYNFAAACLLFPGRPLKFHVAVPWCSEAPLAKPSVQFVEPSVPTAEKKHTLNKHMIALDICSRAHNAYCHLESELICICIYIRILYTYMQIYIYA